MTITIDGFVLPTQLEKLIEAGKWDYPTCLFLSKEMLADFDTQEYANGAKIACFGLEVLKHNKKAFDLYGDETFFADYERGWAWASSKRTGKPITDKTKIDIDRTIIIAGTHGDEWLCLEAI
ncbi:MAG: hypothetical protein AAFQ07_18170 [Chloroflexota bacterium]